MRILVVDDDAVRAASLAKYIQENSVGLQHDIHFSDTASDAKSVLRDLYFDLLILDVVLPNRSDSKSDPAVGLGLLRQLVRANSLKKPSLIIGITAHISDISTFRETFDEHCQLIIEAKGNELGWKRRILDFIEYNSRASIDRKLYYSPTTVVTVHGIRTFGQWQSRLESLCRKKTDDIAFKNYRYGFFSAVAFLIPLLRERETDRLVAHLDSVLDSSPKGHLVIVSHSFGTMLAINSLQLAHAKLTQWPNVTVILCGSVLHRRKNLSLLFSHPGLRIINDCGDRDHILCLSNAFVLKSGMAGRTGLYGMGGQNLVNRFFNGGHSLYFEEPDFMERYWLPIIFQDVSAQIDSIDLRVYSVLNDSIIERVAVFLGGLKPLTYIVLLSFAIFFIFR